ncbi:MAG: NAD-dependent epimerase/dehydratase family protein [Aquabacterium sp.]|nr:MAG: NAD-dependent epimerase/dehydratase family protein [Aquabacterium sp.]
MTLKPDTKVLVLGGAGFIGSNVVRALVARGIRPKVLTRPSRSQTNLRDVLERIELVHGDFMDDNVLRNALRGVHTVFHLITTTFPNMVTESSNYDLLSNLLPTIRLLEMSRALGVTRVVYASSGGTIYGEPQSVPIAEDHPLAPKSAYGQSKLTIENYMSFYARTTPLEVSILRLSNPYGPGQNPFGAQGVIAVAMGCLLDNRPIKLFGEGRTVRDYIYVDDAVDAMLKATETPPGVLNISSGRGHSVAEILEMVERVSGRRLERQQLPERQGDVLVNVLDNRRAQDALGWVPRIDLREGLHHTWVSMRGRA